MRWSESLIATLVLAPIVAFASAGPTVLRVGVLDSGPTAEGEANWDPWAEAIVAAMGEGQQLRMVILPPDALRAAVLRNDLEVVITNPVHFIEIRAEHPLSGAVATMDMDPGEPSTPWFGGVIVRRRDQARWANLGDLRGARVAYQDRGLLGGYAAPMKRLLDAGVSRRDLRLIRVGSPYGNVLEAVRDGRADVGFLRTGLLERWALDGDPRLADFAVVGAMTVPGFPHVTSTPVYPEWPVVLLPHVDESLGRRFAQAVLAMEPGSPALQAAGIERITVPADYASVEAVMRDIRLPPFDSPVQVAWNDVWQSHRGVLIAGIVGLLAALSAGVLSVRSRLRHKRDAQALAAAKQAAEDERRRLHGILGAVRAGTWEWNVQTGELRINRHWAEMIGYRLDELVPITVDTWRARVHPDDLVRATACLEAHLRGEASHYEVDIRMRHKAGHWVWMHDRGEVVARDADGRPLWMCGLHLDVGDPEAAPNADATAWAREGRSVPQ